MKAQNALRQLVIAAATLFVLFGFAAAASAQQAFGYVQDPWGYPIAASWSEMKMTLAKMQPDGGFKEISTTDCDVEPGWFPSGCPDDSGYFVFTKTLAPGTYRVKVDTEWFRPAVVDFYYDGSYLPPVWMTLQDRQIGAFLNGSWTLNYNGFGYLVADITYCNWTEDVLSGIIYPILKQTTTTSAEQTDPGFTQGFQVNYWRCRRTQVYAPLNAITLDGEYYRLDVRFAGKAGTLAQRRFKIPTSTATGIINAMHR